MSNFTAAATKWFGSLLLLIAVVVVCHRHLDIPVALWVQEHLYSNADWARHTGSMPDLLLQVVALVTIFAVSLYLVRLKKGRRDRFNQFLLLLAWAAPVSFLSKSGLKTLFGGQNTRYWLEHPELYGFHWFTVQRGFDGFPSGHMLVIVSLMAALIRFYPLWRAICAVLALLLGLALIATNYHFLSEVLAGTYAGIGLEALLYRLLSGRSCFSGSVSAPKGEGDVEFLR